MAMITTHELFDKYFEEKDPEFVRKIRNQIERPELYEYEEKIGKQFIDMDVDELFDMFGLFHFKKHSEGSIMNYNSYATLSSQYRAIFNYYISHYEPIVNPFNDPRMKGVTAMQRFAQMKETYTWETVEDIIKQVHAAYDRDRANYIECIILLFYNGFANADEIIFLKENMINFKTKEVMLPGKTLALSDKCFNLLTHIHSMDSIDGWRGYYSMASWNDSYFKFIIRPNEIGKFSNRPLNYIRSLINRKLVIDVKRAFDANINYSLLYYLGFYDYIVKQCGIERAKELVTSVRNPNNTEELEKYARSYGVKYQTITILKRLLIPYV